MSDVWWCLARTDTTFLSLSPPLLFPSPYALIESKIRAYIFYNRRSFHQLCHTKEGMQRKRSPLSGCYNPPPDSDPYRVGHQHLCSGHIAHSLKAASSKPSPYLACFLITSIDISVLLSVVVSTCVYFTGIRRDLLLSLPIAPNPSPKALSPCIHIRHQYPFFPRDEQNV